MRTLTTNDGRGLWKRLEIGKKKGKVDKGKGKQKYT